MICNLNMIKLHTDSLFNINNKISFSIGDKNLFVEHTTLEKHVLQSQFNKHCTEKCHSIPQPTPGNSLKDCIVFMTSRVMTSLLDATLYARNAS